MPKRRSPCLDRVIYLLAWAYVRLTRCLPLRVAHFFTRSLAHIIFFIVPRWRRRGLAHLDLAYGEALTPAQKKAILRGVVRNLADVAAEFSRIPSVASGSCKDRVVLEGVEHINLNMGALFFGAHSANWEWLAPAFVRLGKPLVMIVRPLDNPRLDRLIESIRAGGGVRLLSKDNAAGEFLRLLREGWFGGVLIDQSARENAVPTTFFGQPCWSTAAPVIFAMRAQVPLHPLEMFRTADAAYVLRIHPPLFFTKSGKFAEDLLRYSQQCQDIIESFVRAHPEQWLWLHRRWKKNARLEAEWEKRLGQLQRART